MSQTKTSSDELFRGRRLVIGAKHDKGKVVAPVIEKIIGVHCLLAENFDTDSMGTFTREVERTDDPLTTVRKQCPDEMDANDPNPGIASKGSFRSHPDSFFLPADDELLIFIDRKTASK